MLAENQDALKWIYDHPGVAIDKPRRRWLRDTLGASPNALHGGTNPALARDEHDNSYLTEHGVEVSRG